MIANSTDAQAVLFGANADGGYRARLGEQFQTILRSRSDIRNIGETLAGMKVEDRIHLQGLQPSRADIVVHGICILLGVMERLGRDRITVSEWGNLDGYVSKYYCG